VYSNCVHILSYMFNHSVQYVSVVEGWNYNGTKFRLTAGLKIAETF